MRVYSSLTGSALLLLLALAVVGCGGGGSSTGGPITPSSLGTYTVNTTTKSIAYTPPSGLSLTVTYVWANFAEAAPRPLSMISASNRTNGGMDAGYFLDECRAANHRRRHLYHDGVGRIVRWQQGSNRVNN